MKCKTILVVEDELDIRETVEDVLRTEGYQVYAAENGREALQALKRIPGPTLILLDMMMPLFNGWEFIEAQQDSAKFVNLPVVLVTALDANKALVNGNKLIPAKGYLRKPIDLDTLLETVRIYCGVPGDAEVLAEPHALPHVTGASSSAMDEPLLPTA